MTTKISKMPGRAGGSKDVDARLELLSGLMGKLDEIASAVAKIAAVVGTSTQADAPGAKFKALPGRPSQTRQDAPEPQDVPEVARFAACGPRALKAAREAHAQALAVSAGPKGRAAVQRMGLHQFIESSPDVVAEVQASGVRPAAFKSAPADAPHLVGLPTHPSLRPIGRPSVQRSPRGAA